MNDPKPAPVQLRRALRSLEYYTLAFGTMVGTGWLVVMDDWLARGGPAGVMLGYICGALLLIPIARVYARLMNNLPDAGGEIAYCERVFPPAVSFFVGWFMTLAYLAVCPWECIAVGKVLARVFPGLDSMPLFTVADKPVYLGRLLAGLLLTAIIVVLNYRGIGLSSQFQNLCTFGLFAVFAAMVVLGIPRGHMETVQPLFRHEGAGGALLSVLLVLQIVPYFMGGFESISKGSEERHPDTTAQSLERVHVLALVTAAAFYATLVLVVCMLCPWQELTSVPFGTAVAFERAFASTRIGHLILIGATFSLMKVYNGNFIAGTRMLYGLAKRSLIHPALGYVHPRFQTPAVAVIVAGGLTVVASLPGESVLIPITELASTAVAFGWLATCVCFLRGAGWTDGEPGTWDLMMARLGAIVASGFILIKVLPWVPGHLSRAEYLVLLCWVGLGAVLHRSQR
jgi:APA family basic amino acid/polyamine antiporter